MRDEAIVTTAADITSTRNRTQTHEKVEAVEAPRQTLSDAALRMVLLPLATEPWPLERLFALCRLWEAGRGTAELGRVLGCTSNAAVGQAHRMRKHGILSARPHPNTAEAAALREPKAKRYRESRAGYHRGRRARLKDPNARRYGPEPPIPPQPKPRTPFLPPPPLRPPVALGRVVECCWPLGEPGTRAFHFCDAPTEPGRPYCGDHMKSGYLPKLRRVPDASERSLS